MQHLYTLAYNLAEAAHITQTDKGGQPYFGHLLRVSNACNSIQAKIVALLHDIVEDFEYTGVTLDNLRGYGFTDEIIDAVIAITKIDGEDYWVYLARVKANWIATEVKLCDLRDNMNLDRLTVVTDYDLQRVKKYEAAEEYLAA
jgi:guanosine-3',5'-bis(diphosphate) 3'-pyrophosphohydrolase